MDGTEGLEESGTEACRVNNKKTAREGCPTGMTKLGTNRVVAGRRAGDGWREDGNLG
ncbi:uncharacterized protein CIMG_13311 [Coccidioides immitis RS]|uniref:Uncharacterized protein n=1 Tax=Coccidioides immitis (strain RS) TaxID=246410 RepID=A0A0D8JU74_COCIM|nr:uncharacterized protein CIMG_13311 [Coccidioides immitis RS]KJF60900.1 hypothetical protein CIMG_13311 [Coccidioides immitis RS]